MFPGLVIDTSVWLNLLATGYMDDILRSISCRKVVVCAVSREVLRHPLSPNAAVHPLRPYLDAGLLEEATLQGESAAISLELTMAPSPDGLDHGESATIAVALTWNMAAAIDERKARRIAGERFPAMQIVSTVDILRTLEVAESLNTNLSNAVLSALKHARMRVPPEHDPWVRNLLSPTQISECPSLKRRVVIVTK